MSRMKIELELFMLVLRLCLHILDVISDIYVAVQYGKNGEWWWFVTTLIFIIVPSVIVNFVVLTAYGDERSLSMIVIGSIFKLSTIHYYCQELLRMKKSSSITRCKTKCQNHECQECESYEEEKKRRARSSYKLDIIGYVEAFTESAPQWCVQNYIMLRQWSFPWYTIASTVFSLLLLAWSITSLELSKKTHVSTSLNRQRTFSIKSLVVLLTWQLCVLISRLSAIVIFAYVFTYYMFIIIDLHWLIVVIVSLVSGICFGNMDEAGYVQKVCKLFFFSYPMMFHISSFVARKLFENITENHFKALMFLFHVLLLLENSIMVSLVIWYEQMDILGNIALVLVFGGFGTGMLFLGLYYGPCHPSRRIYPQENTTEHNKDEPENSETDNDLETEDPPPLPTLNFNVLPKFKV